MAKKTASKPNQKKVASSRSKVSKSAPSKPGARAAAGKKKVSKNLQSSKKPSHAKEASAKKPTNKVIKKAPAKKAASNTKPTKKTAKKTTKKIAGKTTPTTPAKRGSSNTTTKKPASKAPTKKPTTKKSASSTAAKKPAPTKKSPGKTTINTTSGKTPNVPSHATSGGKPDAGARKGITVVTKKSPRRPRSPPAGSFMMPSSGMTGFGAALGKPLIPSGPAAQGAAELAGDADSKSRRKKTPFTKRELTKFRKVLVAKREELSGEVSQLEKEALGRGGSNQRSKSQAVDDQGSEAADQAIGLDLVAAERRLLTEIIAAIRRVDDGTYGICELTAKAINKERLEELPWTRYSIDAARQLERRSLGS